MRTSPSRLQALAHAALGTLLSATLTTLPGVAQELPSIGIPSAALRQPTFQESAMRLGEDLVPIVGGLKAKSVAPLASKAVALAATGDPKQIMLTLDAGLDAFLSVPPERFFAAAKALKEGTRAAAEAATECNLVCLPPIDKTLKVAQVAADALSVTDPVKLRTFVLQGGMSLASGEKQQYAGVLTEAVKFSFSLDKGDLLRAKDSGVALLLSADNAQPARAAPSLSQPKTYPQNAAVTSAAVRLADASYPLVKGLTARSVAPLASKAVSLGTTGDPKQIIRTLDAGLDAFLSVPPERFVAAVKALKEGTAAAAAASECNLVCVPPPETVRRVAGTASNALSVTDPQKLERFLLQLLASLESGDDGQLVSTLAEAKRFEASLNAADVSNVKAAARELFEAAGVRDPVVLGLFG